MSAHPDEAASDAELSERARNGDAGAFARLWERHAAAGLRFAGALTQSFDADDLVAEAYERILTTLRRGAGPRGPFRPYLFVTIRSVAIAWAKRRREVSLEDSEDVPDHRATDARVLAATDATLTIRAFRSLPERWQEVLWFTEVDGLPSSEVAARLGLTVSGVGMLALRAREGLRQAWIQAHINSAPTGSEHRWALEHVGQHARGKLRVRARQRFEAHLRGCAACTVIAADAVDTSNHFTTMLVPLAAGITGAAGLSIFAGQAASSPAQASTMPRSPARVGPKGRLLLVGGATAVVAVVGAAVGLASSPERDSHQPIAEPTTPSATSSPPPTTLEQQTPSPTAQPSTVPAPTTAPSQESSVPLTLTGIDTQSGRLYPLVSGTAQAGATVNVRSATAATTVVADSVGQWHAVIMAPVGNTTVTATTAGQPAVQATATVAAPEAFAAAENDTTRVRIQGLPTTAYRVTVPGQPENTVTTNQGGTGTMDAGKVSAEGGTLTVQAVDGDRSGPPVTIAIAAQ